MKIAIALLALSTSAILSAQAEPPNTMTAEIANDVFITLSSEPCTEYEMPPNVFLWKATGIDKSNGMTATGCFSLEDNMVILNLTNDQNKNRYGYVLKQDLFKP
jgi:hypothetical protein